MPPANKEQSNKPANTLFKQQRLAAWQPIMSPPHVSACFIIVAAIFLPLGFAIMSANNKIVDVEVRYDHVRKCTYADNDGLFRFDANGGTYYQGCRTQIKFNVPSEMTPPVYMYYKLENFYQNHRRFAKSRNDKQLVGNDVSGGSMSDTEPLLYAGENHGSTATQFDLNGVTRSYGSMVYNPAGLIAWSMFNDSFTLYRDLTNGQYELVCNGSNFAKTTNQAFIVATVGLPSNVSLPANEPNVSKCTKDGIAWESDVDAKYKTPALTGSTWSAMRSYFAPAGLPPTDPNYKTYFPSTNDDYFGNGWYANEPGHAVPVPLDQDLMVWMRTASLPNFRKLYRKIDVTLPAGDYVMEIDEVYDVSTFDGTKSFALSTVTWVGGKNEFLSIAYMAVGFAAVLCGIVFFIIHKVNSDRTQQAIDSLSELSQ